MSQTSRDTTKEADGLKLMALQLGSSGLKGDV